MHSTNSANLNGINYTDPIQRPQPSRTCNEVVNQKHPNGDTNASIWCIKPFVALTNRRIISSSVSRSTSRMPEEKCSSRIEESCEIPAWLNSDYFEQLLKKVKGDSTIKVQSVDVKYALPKGENYASVIYRVQVVFHRKDQLSISRSYIVKGMALTDLAVQKLGEYNVYEKEMDVYELVVPELKRLSRSLGDRSELYPSALTVDRDHSVIIFDDLSKKGFIMPDRSVGLDLTHMKMSLQLTAKLHATSLKLAEMHPTIFDRYTTGMMTRETDAFYPFFYETFDALTNEISTWDPKWHYYSNKLRKLRPYFIEQGLKVFDHESDDDLRVFAQGDLWVNNLLFKYDSNGKPIDLVLLDFQFACYATPMIDLCYFFFTSANDELRQSCFEELMQYYYYHLACYTKRLGYSKKFPTLHQFQKQLFKKLFYGK